MADFHPTRLIRKEELLVFLEDMQKDGNLPKSIIVEDLVTRIFSQRTIDGVFVDNYLDNQTRSAFYRLESKQIAESFSQFVRVFKRSFWRIHFWKLNDRMIIEKIKDANL
jgi:hypothetical protein